MEITLNLKNLTITEQIVFYSLIISFAIELFYIIFFYLRFLLKKFPKTKGANLPVSVIIAAKNEAENLRKFLPSILEQNYDNYEVIVVNDASSDDTEIILAELKQKYKHLYFTNIPENQQFKHGKKLALSIGIKAAKNEFLIFTDADCKPLSKNWIKSIVANFDEQTIFVIGYGGYFAQKGLLNKLIRSDTVQIAITYFSFANAGIPYMGVGRNMAYRKSFFNKVQGFKDHWNLLSGSDDLFINKYANAKNLKIEISPESLVKSIPKNKFKNFVNQKIRHFSTAPYYKFKHKLLLGIELLMRIIFFTTVITSFFIPKITLWAIILFIIRFILLIWVYTAANKRFQEKNILIMEIFYDFFQLFFNLYIYIKKSLSKNKNYYVWK